MNLILGDCLNKLKEFKPDSIDSLVTDPPAGISFMGKAWDHDHGGRLKWITHMTLIFSECLRIMKPGAHGLVWALPRTSHWTGAALEEAGFEVRDVISHLFGSGFPKSLNVSKAIDKAAGLERKLIPRRKLGQISDATDVSKGWKNSSDNSKTCNPVPLTDSAKQWDGFGTALKPAVEMWFLVRKPLSEKTVAANVLKWGCGALNIDGTRIPLQGDSDKKTMGTFRPAYDNPNTSYDGTAGIVVMGGSKLRASREKAEIGRFPANLVLSHSEHCTHTQCDLECAVAMLDQQSGVLKSGAMKPVVQRSKDTAVAYAVVGPTRDYTVDKSIGGASRFYYCAKISTRERNEGLDRFYSTKIDCATWNVANMEVGQLLLRAILESMPSLNIVASGDLITVISPKDTLSTTRMEINKITKSKTWNWLMQSLTNGCIPAVNLRAGHGGNIVQSAKNLRELMTQIGTLPGKDGSLLVDAAPAILKSLQKISKEDAWELLKSAHPTVKPKRLMRYLCRLITPPNGIILDPFMGSGSTGIAAKEEGFEFVGIEKEAEYFEIAGKRISAVVRDV